MVTFRMLEHLSLAFMQSMIEMPEEKVTHIPPHVLAQSVYVTNREGVNLREEQMPADEETLLVDFVSPVSLVFNFAALYTNRNTRYIM
jgi:hypothetical protein